MGERPAGRRLRIALLVAVGLLCIYGLVLAHYRAKVNAVVGSIAAAGEPTCVKDLLQAPVSAGDNAAGLCREAAQITKRHANVPFGLPFRASSAAPPSVTWRDLLREPAAFAKAVKDHLIPRAGMMAPPSGGTPAVSVGYGMYNPSNVLHLEFLSEFIEADARALELLNTAADRPLCRFAIDPEKYPQALMRPLADMRQLARFLSAAGIVASHQGHQELALERLGMGFALSRHTAQQPAGMSLLVAGAIDEIMHKAAEHVLGRGPTPEQAARSLATELSRLDYLDCFEQGARGDRALGLELYREMRTRPVASLSRLQPAYAGPIPFTRKVSRWVMAKPLAALLYADQLEYLRLKQELIDHARRPWRDSVDYCTRESKETAEFASRSLMTRSPKSTLAKRYMKRDRAIARRAMLHAALGLQVYRDRFGEYPSALSDLEQVNWSVPADIFSGKPLPYRRDGDRFVLYSVGADLRDDGAAIVASPAGGSTVRVGPFEVRAGDILWTWRDGRPGSAGP